MAKSGMNPKTLQYIMGHADISVTLNTYTHVGADISVTLNTYTHVGFEDAKAELERVMEA